MSQMKDWPTKKPETDGKVVQPEQRNRDNPCELKGAFDQRIIDSVLFKEKGRESAYKE
jgi:hypothetical protein